MSPKLLVVVTALVAALAIAVPAAGADSPCQRQGSKYVCPYEYTGGMQSNTLWGGENGYTVAVEAWGAEAGGHDRPGGDWNWPGGRGGYATSTFRVPRLTYVTYYVAVGGAGYWS